MKRPGPRAFALVAGFVVTCVVLLGIFALKDPIREAWYIPRLQSKELGERKEAAGVLAAIGSRQAIPHLVRMYLDGNGTAESTYLVEALIRTGDRGLSALVEALREGDWQSQALAVRTMRREGAPVEYAAQLLQGPLAHPQYEIRARAVRAMEEFGAPMAPHLLEALRAKNRDVRTAAAKALGRLGERGLDSLMRTLGDTGELMRVRVAAAQALSELASHVPAARVALLKAFSDPEKHVRAWATKALETLEVIPGGPHGRLRVKPASGAAGEEVTVAIEATLEQSARCFVLRLEIPGAVATLVKAQVAGTASARIPRSAVISSPAMRGGWLTGVWMKAGAVPAASAGHEDEPLLEVVLRLREDAPPGDYRVSVKEAHFVTGDDRGLEVEVGASGVLTIVPAPVAPEIVTASSSGEPAGVRPATVSETVDSRAKLAGGQYLFRAEYLHTPPGTTEALLRIFATNARQVPGMSVAMRIDPAHVRIRKVQVKGTVLEEVIDNKPGDQKGKRLFRFQPHILDLGETVIGCTDLRPGGSILRPGIEQHVLTVVVDVLPTAPVGAAIPVRLGRFGDPAQECIFVSPEATTQPARTVDGAILIGSSPVPEVRQAAAEVVESGVRLHWENGGDYDAVRIERDGELLPAPGPGSTSYLDAGIEPGFHYYSIVARKGERDSFPVGLGVRFRVDER